MSKEELEKYANKIYEVCLAGVLYPKETVIKTISALVNEYADQQTKEIKEECINWSLVCDKLELKNKEFQEKLNDCTENYNHYVDKCFKLEDLNQQLQSRIDILEKANEWISVEDRLPDEDISVFCYTNVGGRCTCFYKNCNWRYQHNSGLIDTILKITHWMPLPNNPKTN